VIDIINTEKQNLVFLLWGAYAYKKAALIDNNKHLVLTATHPQFRQIQRIFCDMHSMHHQSLISKSCYP
jgi:uracil-DNA glycosylase